MSGFSPTPEEITEPMIVAAFAMLTSRECEVLLWLFRGKNHAVIL
jgi:hypothetical protein